ncbi:MAG: MFS transporter [Bacteroidales bacterium]|nr:MFS transporter [Bacteroidales bacterium]MEE3407354.1 MFS transporter [Candidatus Cryptobacteroides sp.]SKC50328.1 MFS transporter, FHS family, L-fucose permease [Bacteroidales bacterium WCE2008]MBP5235044.1 MFS transporter [Bacteroidales bacterium]MBQ1857823.1 MFS transporter [Bacteroidales bacterium]
MAKKNGNIIAIVTMIFLFGMISFVTNLAAPIGNIWKMQPQIAGSNALGMMGNMMNFLAYLFMGVPAGKMLTKYGYKKTALIAIAVGFIGVFIQFLSGVVASFPANFACYLLGAFISGFSVCMLNTVVNPMLTLIGGEKHGNQYVQIGGTFNSLMGTLTPMLVGALIGTLTAQTVIKDVNPVLYIAMGVFLAAFIALSFIPIEDPEEVADAANAESPWNYKHFIYGVIAIFVYVGVEVGIPGTLNFYLADPENPAQMGANAATVAGFVAGTYWFLMLIGRFLSSLISGKVSAKAQITAVSAVALCLVIGAMVVSPEVRASMPAFTGSNFEMVNVPLSALLLVLCGLCTSVMWGAIFALSVDGLGSATNKASGLFMMMVVGGGIIPLLQNFIADHSTYMFSYILPAIGLAYILFFGLIGSKPAKRVKA